MTPLVEEHRRFWGFLPFKKYVFLNIITGGGGGSGVEHLNSVAITGGAKEPTTPEARFRQASFISHEYFHAMNVKRLRPVELGPFDYENSPVTTGLWVGEGLTSYFGDLLAERAGLGTPREYLALTSKHITDLQNSPGGLSQTLEQSSSQMFERLPRNQTVDYYVKGPVVGLILDAHIRKVTNGKKSMDDVIRLEYKRWSGDHGYTADQFNQTASDAAGIDLKPLLAHADRDDERSRLYGDARLVRATLHSERRSDQSVDARSSTRRDRRADGALRGVHGALFPTLIITAPCRGTVVV